MDSTGKITLYALDCGAVNWRLYRMEYHFEEGDAKHVTSPLSSPLSSFKDRKLPAVLTLNEDGSDAEAIGEQALAHIEDHSIRNRVRDFFKPSIGNHLLSDPLPHQKRFTHFQGLLYSRLLLKTLIQQIQREKYINRPFDEQIHFSIAYPDSWKLDDEGRVFDDFSTIALDCFPPELCDQVHFVPESEGVVFGLQQQGVLDQLDSREINLVIDIGGSTTKLYAKKYHAGTGNLLQVDRYQEPFGGGLYDAVIAKYISDRLEVSTGALRGDPSAFVTLRLKAQDLKEGISQMINVNGMDAEGGFDNTITLVTKDNQVFRSQPDLSPHKFSKVCQPLDDNFQEVLSRGISAMDFEEDDIGRVILIGGGVNMPGVIEGIRNRFGTHKVILPEHPEEIVVRGIGLTFATEVLNWKFTVEIPETRTDTDPSGWFLEDESGEIFPIAQEITMIGRSRESDIQLMSTKASRTHALIKLEGSDLILTDLGSKNGTMVNEYPLEVNKAHLLENGDQLRFGDQTFLLMGG